MKENHKALAECHEAILELLETDIFGSVSEERSVDAIRGKMKEAKTCQSYDSIFQSIDI